MRNPILVMAALLTTAGSLPAQEPTQPEQKKLMCTLPVLRSIAQELAGEKAEIVALSKPDQDPHFVSPTPSLMKKLQEADLFIEVGLQLELWANDVAGGSGNPRIQPGSPGRLVASTGILPEQIPSNLSRSEGDIHPQGNPHLWLDPVRGKAIAQNLANGLKGIGTTGVDDRLHRFQERIDESLFGTSLLKSVGSRALTRKALDGTLHSWLEEKKLSDQLGGWMKKAAPLRGIKVIEFHRTWIYFTTLFGMEIVGSVEPKPGIKPGPRHLEELRETMRRQGVRLILVENYQDPSDPRALERDTGARTVLLPTQPGGESGTDDYFRLLDHILESLLRGLETK